MSQVKLPYYPKVEATCCETTFGAVEITCPKIYEKPLEGLRIVRVDLLECLRECFGDNCFIYRDLLYKLVAGSCSKAEHIELFASFYRRYENITAFVNDLYYFGETEIPIIPRTLQKVRDMIIEYRSTITPLFENAGAKYLVETHDYIYYAFKGNNVVPDVKGVTVIC